MPEPHNCHGLFAWWRQKWHDWAKMREWFGAIWLEFTGHFAGEREGRVARPHPIGHCCPPLGGGLWS
jgi:hypothetical protein